MFCTDCLCCSFFRHQISIDTVKRRRTAAAKLRAALVKKDVIIEEKKFLLSIPAIGDHANHIIGEVRF